MRRPPVGLLLAAIAFALIAAWAGPDRAWSQSPPVVDISSPGEGSILTGSTVIVSGSATGEATITGVEVSTDGGATWLSATIQSGTGTASVTWSYTWTLPAEDNTTDHVLTARATDSAAVAGTATVTPTVRIDNRPPVVTAFYVDDDAEYAASSDVSLTITAVDGSPPLTMRFSNDGSTWSAWQPYEASVAWTLSPGDGLKEVRARLRDSRGNTTTTGIADSITVSTGVPAVSGWMPADGATGVNPAALLHVLFSEAMAPATINSTNVQLWRDADHDATLSLGLDAMESATVSYDSASRSATVRPPSALPSDVRYFLRVMGDVRSASGVALGTEVVATFVTGAGSTTQPAILSMSPPDGAGGVMVTADITVLFDREMETTSLLSGVTLTVAASGDTVAGAVRQDPSDAGRVVFLPTRPLAISTTYLLTVAGSVQDYSGNVLGQPATSTFTTAVLGVNPHGTYNAGSRVCSLCHAVHQAPMPTGIGRSLLKEGKEVELCYTCHNGTGAQSNVQATFALVGSGHVVDDVLGATGAGLTSRCSSCHDPHALERTSPVLHRETINGTPVGGDDYTWCQACHNDTFDWAGTGYPHPGGGFDAAKPLRGADGYPEQGTFPGATAYNNTLFNAHNPTTSTNVVWPDSGLPSGDCRNCHGGHRNAAPRDALRAQYRPTPDAATVIGDRQTGRYAELCLTCHDTDGPALTDIKQAVTFDADKEGTPYTGGHRIRTAGGILPVGAPLPCYDCHNPHGSTGNNGAQPNKDLLSDERWSDIDTSNTTGVVRFCLQCHLPWEYAADSGRPEQNTIPAGQATLIEGLDRRDPTNALSLPRGMSAHAKANLDTPGLSCYSCHGADYGPPAADAGYNVHRPEQPGGCVDCHTKAREGWALTRRPVVGEFAGAGHHVRGGDVTDEDCGVCHLERDRDAGKFSATLHADGAIDLRGPDTGLALTPFTTLVRDTSSNVLEAEVLVVQNSLCLECHDSNGAASPDAQVSGATAARPFSANSADAADIRGALDPVNSFTHGVRTPGASVTCFDCHVTTAGHGGANADAGRTDFSSVTGQRELCLTCHNALVYEGGASGSRFGEHGVSGHTLSGGNSLSCRGCHAGTQDLSGLSEPNGSPGNIHGGSFTWPGSSPTPLSPTGHFLYGGWLSGWVDGTCWGGTCHHTGEGVPY
ncbi:MAG: Ig-like domain-containing protein [Thermoleophilia bacterium]